MEDDDSVSQGLGRPNVQALEEKTFDSVKVYIGPITAAERLEKVRRYLKKKHGKRESKQHVYTCRKHVA